MRNTIKFKLDEQDFEKLVSGEWVKKEFFHEGQTLFIEFFLSDIGYDLISAIVDRKYTEFANKQLKKNEE